MKKRVKILLWILWVIALLWAWVYCYFRFVATWTYSTEPLPSCCDKSISRHQRCMCGGKVARKARECACGVEPVIDTMPDCCNKNISRYQRCICGDEVISDRQECECGIEPIPNPNENVRNLYDDLIEKKCNNEWGEMHYLFQPDNYFEICIFEDDTFCYIEDFDNWECNKLNIGELWEYKDLWTFVLN